ncbi:MAG: TIM barrel protein [Nocardioides sp.]|uniref:sugar phosphate isomerase/epimerase family protein n=1 Tax=Nocardioides sp. TaxID=35761 RepID=UPI0039E34863
MTTTLGLAALTVLDTAPFDQIGLAESCGYDSVGFRLLPASPGTTAYPLHTSRHDLDAVAARLADSDVTVLDVEIVRLDAGFELEAHRRLLETAAALGARAILVAGDDPDRARLADSYAALAEACAAYRLAASLEFMPWTAVPDVRTALAVVAQAAGPARSVLVDTLHAGRSATSLTDLRDIPPDWVHYGQLCDAETPTPATQEELIHDARNHRLAPGEGGLDLTGMWSTLPSGTPVSVEVPNPARRTAMGTSAWLRHLARRARAVVGSVR